MPVFALLHHPPRRVHKLKMLDVPNSRPASSVSVPFHGIEFCWIPGHLKVRTQRPLPPTVSNVRLPNTQTVSSVVLKGLSQEITKSGPRMRRHSSRSSISIRQPKTVPKGCPHALKKLRYSVSPQTYERHSVDSGVKNLLVVLDIITQKEVAPAYVRSRPKKSVNEGVTLLWI